MKTGKRKIGFVFLLLAGLFFISCSGNSGGGTTTTVVVPGPEQPVVIGPRIKTEGFKEIPAGDSREIINVLGNEEFVTSHPELEATVRQMVADMNAILAKYPGNKKEFALGKVMTYPGAADLYSIGKNSDYFTDNKFVGNPNYGGTTIAYWTQPGQLSKDNLPQFFKDMGGGTGYASSTIIGGKRYGLVFIADPASETPLLGRDKLGRYVNGLDSYDAKMKTLAHEFGHTFGLALDEWYQYEFQDATGELPNLGVYSRPSQFPEDPMSGADVIKYNIREYKFAPFHSWLINKNANHQYNLGEIAEGIPAEIRVRVVDSAGLPVSGASVKVFAGVLNGKPVDTKVLLLNTATGVMGEVSITTDDSAVSIVDGQTFEHRFSWKLPAKIIKASFNGKSSGAVLTLTDLEIAYLQQGVNVYTLNLVL